jgi:hypothetical protein
MIFALDRGLFLKIFVTLVAGILAIVVLRGDSSSAIWAARDLASAIVGFIVLLLCVPPLFRFVHRVTFAKFWLFPLLDGEWDAVICSNWPRIRRTHRAATGIAATFNALTDDLTPEEEASRKTLATVTIVSTLMTITIKLEPQGTNRVSVTRFVRPVWSKPAWPELSYVYEQTDPDPVPVTDIKRHFGAGVLTYDREKDTIAGEYWTQRRDEAGFNTAGTIALKRKATKARRGKS